MTVAGPKRKPARASTFNQTIYYQIPEESHLLGTDLGLLRKFFYPELLLDYGVKSSDLVSECFSSSPLSHPPLASYSPFSIAVPFSDRLLILTFFYISLRKLE